MKEQLVTKKILNWYDLNKRSLPWRKNVSLEKKQYFTLVSEFMLQQTQVITVIPYFNNFIKNIPNLRILAKVQNKKLIKLWEGLGYYSRARNLHYTAKYIMSNYNGKFPENYKDILDLKGIGPYTAAAISSIAFGLPYAVVDGNVVRVLSRVFNIDIAYDTNIGKKIFSQKAQELILKSDPSSYNQALMEFGALQCKPKLPNCSTCIFQKDCIAATLFLLDAAWHWHYKLRLISEKRKSSCS